MIGGNVGIGSTIPNATLHVVGNMILKATSTSNASPILNISGNDGRTACIFTINGDFQCNGTKSATVDTSFAERKLYAIESPDVRHIDEGRAKLRKGFANISLDPIFKETIEENYNVYLTPEGKTKALYVDEKARDYFIVKDTSSTNAVFSYIISAYRKGYESKRFDSGSDIEITATIDTDTTEIELSGNLAQETTLEPQTAQQSQESAQSSQETQQNTTSNNTTLAISIQEASQTQQPNSVAVVTGNAIKIVSKSMTGNVINELGLETDLSRILDNSSTISQGNLSGTSPEITSSNAEIDNKNLINETIINNATSVTEQPKDDGNEKMTITDETYKYMEQASEDKIFDISKIAKVTINIYDF